MQTIHKYPIHMLRDTTLIVPRGARIVRVGMSSIGGELLPCIWMLIDPDAAEMIPRKFRIHGTGVHVSDDWDHCGTFFNNPFVWHVFEEDQRDWN